MHKWLSVLAYLSISTWAIQIAPNITTIRQDIDIGLDLQGTNGTTERDKFLDDLVAKLTIPELGMT